MIGPLAAAPTLTRSVTVTGDTLHALAAGVKSYSVDIGAALPLDARLIACLAAVTVEFTATGNNTAFSLEIAEKGGSKIFVNGPSASRAFTVGTSTPGTPNFNNWGGNTLKLTLTGDSGDDLNTTNTGGSMTVTVFFTIAAG